MIRVRRHIRQLASGKTADVRQHERQGMPRQDATAVHDSGSWWDGSAEPVPEGDYPPGTSFFRQGDEVFAAHPDGSVHPVVSDGDGDGEPEASDDFRAMVAQQPGLGGERHARLVKLRDAGYDGPVDQDGNPASRKDLFKARFRLGREQEKALDRAQRARTREEFAAANADFKAAGDKLKVLPGAFDHQPRRPTSRRSSPSATERLQDEMRHWRSLPEPQPSPEPPMSPQMAKLLGCDTPEGRVKYDRLRAYREAGYKGPLDQDNQIPDPDDPANHGTLSAAAGLSEI